MSSAKFGSWVSPITSQLITQGSLRLGAVRVESGGSVVWSEGRPQEGGRQVLVRQQLVGAAAERQQQPVDILPAGFNARSTVHEYGGGEFLCARGCVYFSNFEDQRLHVLGASDAPPKPLTTKGPLRFADCVLDAKRNRLIAVVLSPRNACVVCNPELNENSHVSRCRSA
jgi:hypothetical protein